MNENQNVDIDREQDNGQITYANEVISTIVSVATTEVDGISAIAGNSGLLGKGKLPLGVSFEKENEELQQSQKIALSLEAEEEQHALEEGKAAQETQAQERAEDEPTDEAADEPTEEDAGQEEESSEQA